MPILDIYFLILLLWWPIIHNLHMILSSWISFQMLLAISFSIFASFLCIFFLFSVSLYTFLLIDSYCLGIKCVFINTLATFLLISCWSFNFFSFIEVYMATKITKYLKCILILHILKHTFLIFCTEFFIGSNLIFSFKMLGLFVA